MSSSQEVLDINERGWTQTAFDIPEADRADYAQAANMAISIALEDEAVMNALKARVHPVTHEGTGRTGQFGIGWPRNSPDNRVYLHTGFQSREEADAVMPERNQPSILHDFWDKNEAMLYGIEANTHRILELIGAEALEGVVFPTDQNIRNVHLRTVRYNDALSEPVGTEVISGHADIGLMTWHLYETHGGWLRAAPYPLDVMEALDSPERRGAIRAMRGSMQILEQSNESVPFLIDANLSTYRDAPEGLRNLPACYHAGFRPSPEEEKVSIYAESVAGNDKDRVSVVCFMHPNGNVLNLGEYVPAAVAECRPEY